MPKTILLHIGTPKTGTTSIQEALRSAGASLEPVRYPLMGRHRAHSRLFTIYFPYDQWPAHWKRDIRAEEGSSYRRFLFGELANAQAAILSAEDLSDRFTLSTVERFRRDLEDAGFERFHVVLYVRDPADYYLSLLQQTLKTVTDLGPQFVHPAEFRYEFRGMAQTWEKVFPGDLTVRAYPRDGRFDVVRDFATLVREFLGVSPMLTSVRSNATVSAEAMAILQDYRLRFWPDNDIAATPAVTTLAQSLHESTAAVPQTRPVLKREVAECIRTRHIADMDYIRGRYGVDLTSTAKGPVDALYRDEGHLVGDVLESIDADAVHEMLLRLAHLSLQKSHQHESAVRDRIHVAVRRLRQRLKAR